MITHVIVELKYPVEDEYFHMDTVFPNEYYGYGTPLVRCKDCKWFDIGENPHDTWCTCIDRSTYFETHAQDYCSRAEKKQ